eukprot:6184339-Pleurochrysis_carterae.AAC.3
MPDESIYPIARSCSSASALSEHCLHVCGLESGECKKCGYVHVSLRSSVLCVSACLRTCERVCVHARARAVHMSLRAPASACPSLAAASLNLAAPFSCDITSPVVFLIIKKAPDLSALRRAREEERKRSKQAAKEAKEVTYKVVKQGSGTWKKWETVTERVSGSLSREDMLQKRVEMKADRFCK